MRGAASPFSAQDDDPLIPSYWANLVDPFQLIPIS